MENKQTVYFRFPAGSEGAERMKKLVDEITLCEKEADALAAKLGAKEYFSDSTVEFGGIGMVMFDRKPKSSVFKEVQVLKPEDGSSLCQLDRGYQLNVDSEDVVITEKETQKHLHRKDVLVSSQHYSWTEIKHRLTIYNAAEMCGYRLTGDREKDDNMITMQLGGEKFRIVTFLKSQSDEAKEWYKALHKLPTLPLFSSNRYAAVTDEYRIPVYFFPDNKGNFYCKAPAYSSLEHEVLTESAFNSVYTELNSCKS